MFPGKQDEPDAEGSRVEYLKAHNYLYGPLMQLPQHLHTHLHRTNKLPMIMLQFVRDVSVML